MKKLDSATIHNQNFGNVETYYSTYYSRMMGADSEGIMSALWRYPHNLMEKNFRVEKFFKVLEVGAGEGEHLLATNVNCVEYTVLDIDEKRLNSINDKSDLKIVKVVGDATNTKLESNSYDRLIATCLLAHLPNPELALLEWRRLVKANGVISIYLPCEPGIALKTFRKFFSSRKASSLGFHGFDLYIARDHINDAARMITLINHVFREDQISFKFRPLPIKTWYLNLFAIAEIKMKK